jgi:hypothetical protein
VPPAGITKRVGNSRRTRITNNPLHRAGRLYLCRRCPRPLPAASQMLFAQWSRPVRIDGCSMFARTPRYGLAPPGIRSAARLRATGQNGSSRHVLALFDSSSWRISEHRSGLLIRGFGVQVPGGAPVLTRGFRLQVVLLSELVGPMWDRLQSVELSFLPSGMLKGRLTRRVGVVRVLGHSTRARPRAVVGAFPGA